MKNTRTLENETARFLTSRETPVFRWSSFFSDPARVFFLVASFVLNIFLWGTVLWFFGFGKTTIVLRYNAYFGVDITGSSWQASLLPFLSLVFLLLNILLAALFFRRSEPLVSLLFLLASFFVQIAAGVAVGALLLINS